ncbi:MAG: sensor histidine kinase, partial [Crocinitomicaceae bacterium]|nr:sensor histidine kinase [Crocinitomicaceae bacterium]
MIGNLSYLGVHDGLTTHEKKIHIFFNQISLFGGGFMLLQALFFTISTPSLGGWMFIGPFGSIIGLYLHQKGNFTTARVVSFSLVMIGGGIPSALLGKEYAFHLASLTVIIANVICFSKKEIFYSIIPISIAAIFIGLTESNALVQTFPSLDKAEYLRTGTIIGTLIFVLVELYFITWLGEESENVADTKYKKARNTVSIQNEEIQLMMREIHHRVKNNLQIIISLLRLRSNDLTDEKAKNLFDTTIDRIQSMSILHQKIYQSKNISKFNVQDYIETLTNNLIQSNAVDSQIDLSIKSNVEEINNDFVVSFALILNELISNSLKHGFGDEIKGGIEIEFMKNDGHTTLFYKDTGNWKENPDTNSFGLELIGLLTEQIQGTFERKLTSSGTEYHF